MDMLGINGVYKEMLEADNKNSEWTVGKNGDKLSGRDAALLCIVRAFMANPDLLVTAATFAWPCAAANGDGELCAAVHATPTAVPLCRRCRGGHGVCHPSSNTC